MFHKIVRSRMIPKRRVMCARSKGYFQRRIMDIAMKNKSTFHEIGKRMSGGVNMGFFRFSYHASVLKMLEMKAAA